MANEAYDGNHHHHLHHGIGPHALSHGLQSQHGDEWKEDDLVVDGEDLDEKDGPSKKRKRVPISPRQRDSFFDQLLDYCIKNESKPSNNDLCSFAKKAYSVAVEADPSRGHHGPLTLQQSKTMIKKVRAKIKVDPKC